MEPKKTGKEAIFFKVSEENELIFSCLFGFLFSTPNYF
jgi:hypothetical protein